MSGEVYALVIIDIAHERLDRPFEYRVPEELRSRVNEGAEVRIPFGKGNRERCGYVVGLTDTPSYERDKIKDIAGLVESSVGIENRMLKLAVWIKKKYGGTLVGAMRTVLPVKERVAAKVYRSISRNVSIEQLSEEAGKLNPVRFAARIRLMKAVADADEIPVDLAVDKLNVSKAVIATAVKQGLIKLREDTRYRNPVAGSSARYERKAELSDEQKSAVHKILEEASGERRPVLIEGVTGSGKTEVYMEAIAATVEAGRQAIVLIPEIALTFQTLMRFYARFKDRVSVLHSKLSDGERYDQFVRARKGEIDVIIGPRSALFIPFKDPGMVVIDEEHESSYKNQNMPKYHAREVAEELCRMCGAQLVLGSATPSMEASYRAECGSIKKIKLSRRYGSAKLPEVTIADMREELKAGNRSFFSRVLSEKITERLLKGEQTMLFINRRGRAGFVSCRSCGYVVKCPHCDVSLTEHGGGSLVCHYCGYTAAKPALCPECGSKYLAGFRAGTERIEEEIAKAYPSARVIRMDGDTTKSKDAHEKLLQTFAAGEADIMVGTQMIVKGHDFPNVTLVGAIAADMSLNAADYHATERTFSLLAQAAGRAGRGDKPGEVVIQTYKPEHYSIQAAAAQDYEYFYEREKAFREMADYPPFSHMMALQFFSADEKAAFERAGAAADAIGRDCGTETEVMGPFGAVIAKIRDIYRVVVYIRSKNEAVLVAAKDIAEKLQDRNRESGKKEVTLQTDLDPVTAF
ncbi:MAG: primosomal protein N' [Lachnospiraceae bacterium]|nr:primosomal protein N' [Lachnospiraceae bacterium]